MKPFFLTVLFFLSLQLSAQEARRLYLQGLELAKQGDAEAAITAFDRSITLAPDEYLVWYNRGVCKSMLNNYEEALPDFEKALKLAPGFKKACLNRGIARRHLADYDGAMADYNSVLKMDSANGEACYYRGLLYNLLGQHIKACFDFERAAKLGYANARAKLQNCYQHPTADSTVHCLLRLSKKALRNSYGFKETDPVKVGNGPEGGPANARMYLDLLRDPGGRAVQYTFAGSCCPYTSANGLLGKTALLDKYEISYRAADGSKKKDIVYISYFDFEEPMILPGFETIAPR